VRADTACLHVICAPWCVGLSELPLPAIASCRQLCRRCALVARCHARARAAAGLTMLLRT